jgi:hypothetical protein
LPALPRCLNSIHRFYLDALFLLGFSLVLNGAGMAPVQQLR